MGAYEASTCAVSRRICSTPLADSWGGRALTGRLVRVPGILRTRHVSAPVRPHRFNRGLYRRLWIHALRWPQETRLIGCQAVLRHWKRRRFLINHFDQMGARYPHCHLRLTGEGGMRSALEHQVQGLGLQSRVHLMGCRTDPWHVRRALEVNVLWGVRKMKALSRPCSRLS